MAGILRSSRTLIVMALLLHGSWVSGQILTEGLWDFKEAVPYFFDRAAHRADRVTLVIHQGGEGEDRSSYFKDRIRLDLRNDTMAVVRYHRSRRDTLVRRGDGWCSLAKLRHMPMDTGIVRNARCPTEDGHLDDSRLYRRAMSDVKTPLVIRTSISDHHSRLDSITVEGAGMVRRDRYDIHQDHVILIRKEWLHFVELVKGYAWPVLRDNTHDKSLWTYGFDDRGRLAAIDHYSFSTNKGMLGAHDTIRIRYR